MLEILGHNLLSPMILFFGLGVISGLLKSDLSVPENFGKYLAIYLMMSIGFKGGVSVSEIDAITYQILFTLLSAVALSFFLPFIGYFILNLTTSLDKPTSAALAASYGSVSIVTFASAVNFLNTNNIHYSGYMASIVAIMEAPAILSGLFIAHRFAPETNKHRREELLLAKEIFTNGAVLLILGSFFIGFISGKNGLEQVSGFLVSPYQGILCMFLLDMGLVVTRNIQHLCSISRAVILFGIYMPLVGAFIATTFSVLLKLDVGSATLFITLAASCSYIAVPAAMALALPEAKSSVYMPISIGVTFPFNVIFGIPLYFSIAKTFL